MLLHGAIPLLPIYKAVFKSALNTIRTVVGTLPELVDEGDQKEEGKILIHTHPTAVSKLAHIVRGELHR